MKIYLLILVSVFIGYLWGRLSCAIRDYGQREVDKALESYAVFQKQRDLQYPEMIGKWGRP